MTSKDELREKIKQLPFRRADASTLFLRLDAYLTPNELEEYVDQILNLLEGEKQKARIEEHDWYKDHEVYQINGQPIMRPPTIRVVRTQDITKRLATLNKEPNKGEDVDG